jgi:enoyl-CoA hydratase/carnithine racemase
VDAAPPRRGLSAAVSRALGALFSLPKPVVAAVNGHAIAGGCVMACAADYRMMAREPGRIGIPELLVGVPFPVVPLEIMRFAAPPQHLQSLIYRGTTLTADEALQHGLVDAVVDPEGLVDGAVAVAEPQLCRRQRSRSEGAGPQRRRCESNAGPRVDPAVRQCWESPRRSRRFETTSRGRSGDNKRGNKVRNFERR